MTFVKKDVLTLFLLIACMLQYVIFAVSQFLFLVVKNYNVCYLFGRHENMRDRMLVGLGVAFFQQVLLSSFFVRTSIIRARNIVPSPSVFNGTVPKMIITGQNLIKLQGERRNLKNLSILYGLVSVTVALNYVITQWTIIILSFSLQVSPVCCIMHHPFLKTLDFVRILLLL